MIYVNMPAKCLLSIEDYIMQALILKQFLNDWNASNADWLMDITNDNEAITIGELINDLTNLSYILKKLLSFAIYKVHPFKGRGLQDTTEENVTFCKYSDKYTCQYGEYNKLLTDFGILHTYNSILKKYSLLSDAMVALLENNYAVTFDPEMRILNGTLMVS